MGQHLSDKCMFCEEDLEDYHYGSYEENGKRAISKEDEYNDMNICKDCAIKLQGILKTSQIIEEKE